MGNYNCPGPILSGGSPGVPLLDYCCREAAPRSTIVIVGGSSPTIDSGLDQLRLLLPASSVSRPGRLESSPSVLVALQHMVEAAVVLWPPPRGLVQRSSTPQYLLEQCHGLEVGTPASARFSYGRSAAASSASYSSGRAPSLFRGILDRD